MTENGPRTIDVAIVGGGVAGCAMAALVARSGYSVVVIERSSRWRWHACGVFASPAAMAELRSLGLAAHVLDAVARPIPAMRVETAKGTVFRVTYRGPTDAPTTAVGFDREALDGALVDLAVASGAELLRGHTVESVVPPAGRGEGQLVVRGPGGRMTIDARLIIGADGIRSVVARDLGVTHRARLGRRVGLTWHIPDPGGDRISEARMVVLDGAYCGIAPVPGRRFNVGIVLWGRSRLEALARLGAASVGAGILTGILAPERVVHPWIGEQDQAPQVACVATGEQDRAPRIVDHVAGAAPLGHRVSRRAGPGWMLIGDAAGFLDPFSGEGLHRALVSARLASQALQGPSGLGGDLAAYDRAMHERFGAKDLVSLIVQAFLARPAAFEYAAQRLVRRERLGETLGSVMGDLIPARRALDPRFLAALLAP